MSMCPGLDCLSVLQRQNSPYKGAVSEDDMKMSAVNLLCFVFHFLSSFSY
jgi:hypothetical protein